MELLTLVLVFFLTSIVSVVTGSTSVTTVPVMLQFGMEPRSAIATNMFALTMMSLGGSFSFYGKNVIDRRRMPIYIILTVAGSSLGALLLLVTPSKTMPAIISILMIGVVFFSLLRRDARVSSAQTKKAGIPEVIGYAVTFALAVYGGFFSGGYVTILTASFVAFFGLTYLEAVSTTKVVNVFSSLVATAIFMYRGLVDYRLGVILGVVMFVGAIIGGRVTLKLSSLWLRRIFLAAVVGLALKILLYGLFRPN